MQTKMKTYTLLPAANTLPERLLELPQPVEQLHVVGEGLQELLQQPTVGVVGSRKVSPYGRGITNQLVEPLARRGIIIVSGLALGVDSIAHEAALKAGGKTIAVLPSGLKNIYPPSHHDLARRIANGRGALVTEYSSSELAASWTFIARNRIIAALSDVLLVTEAAERSGSLHTARFALEQGKTVLAVPGNITSPTSAGTNSLIKAGATPVTNVEDILRALDIDENQQRVIYYGENEAEEAILALLRSGIENGEELLTGSNLSVSEFQQHLSMLEINGVIVPLGNNSWKLQ
jgi:DNA processing protein